MATIGNTYNITAELIRNSQLLTTTFRIAAPSARGALDELDQVFVFDSEGVITEIDDPVVYRAFQTTPPQIGDTGPIVVSLNRVENREDTLGISEGE